MTWWRWMFGKRPEAAPRPQVPLPKEALPERRLEVVEPKPVVMKTPRLPRGIRNNNPGNIRHGSARWRGMANTQTDPAFIQFTEAKWGIRALARLLLNYQSLHGLNTVRGIINRWAPPVENDTEAYVNQIALACGVGPDTPIDVRDYLPKMVPAIIKHENGVQPYTEQEIKEGILIA